MTKACPCESGHIYQHCCAPYHFGEKAPNAEALMRSRYSAYVLQLERYLLNTWHPSTRPASLNLENDQNTKWLGLTIKNVETINDTQATVEFVARYKIGGNRAERLHEISQFTLTDQWYYVSGDIN